MEKQGTQGVLFVDYIPRTGILLLRTVVGGVGEHTEKMCLPPGLPVDMVQRWLTEWAERNGISYVANMPRKEL
jgi:hypothetical protein